MQCLFQGFWDLGPSGHHLSEYERDLERRSIKGKRSQKDFIEEISQNCKHEYKDINNDYNNNKNQSVSIAPIPLSGHSVKLCIRGFEQ